MANCTTSGWRGQLDSDPAVNYIKRAVNKPARNERDFLRIAAFATALSFAMMGAVLVSIRVSPHVAFIFSFWTVLAFIVGALMGWYLWEIPRRRAEQRTLEREQDDGPTASGS